MYEGKELVELLNETTATASVYAVSPKMKQLLEQTGEAQLGAAMPEQPVGSPNESDQIRDALVEFGKAKGLEDADIAVELVIIPTFCFESGWDYGVQWPESFDIRNVGLGPDSKEYDAAVSISSVLPEGECIWGFGFADSGEFMISTVAKDWEEDADVANNVFSSYAEEAPGIFRRVKTGVGEDSIQGGVTWNPDLYLVEEQFAKYAR